MSEEKILGVLREFSDAYVSKNVEMMLSFLTEDAVWVTAMGTFRGKEDVKRYFAWDVKATPGAKLRQTGVGIVVKGNKAFSEAIEECIMPDHGKLEFSLMFVFEFSNDKIQQGRVYYDRLAIAKQAAKGWMEKKAVDGIINAMEKGLG